MEPTKEPSVSPTKEPTESPSSAPTQDPYELIIKQDAGYSFSDNNAARLANENDPSATLYSIIDTFDTTKQSLYKGIDGKFQFRLEYDNQDNSQDILIWKQSNWLLDNYVTNAEFIDVPTQSPYTTANCEYFYGLALSETTHALIDGNGADGCWYDILSLNVYVLIYLRYLFRWNGVGVNYNVIAGFRGKIADAARLYILPGLCYNACIKTKNK